MWKRCGAFGGALAYRPRLRQLEAVLFGDVRAGFTHDAAGHEAHAAVARRADRPHLHLQLLRSARASYTAPRAPALHAALSCVWLGYVFEVALAGEWLGTEVEV